MKAMKWSLQISQQATGVKMTEEAEDNDDE